MTDKERILEKLKPMGHLYKDTPSTQDPVGRATWQSYVDALASYNDVELIEQACDYYIRTSTNVFFPSMGDLVKAIRAVLTSRYEDKNTAWQEVSKSLRKGRFGQPVFKNKITTKVVDTMGWWYLVESDNIGIDRNTFFKLYEEIKESEIEQYLSNRR